MMTSATDLRIVRFAFWASAVAGVIGASTLVSLRLNGLLPADRYPWTLIAIQSILLVVFIPGMLWLAQQEWLQPWFERLGAVMLFGVIPLLVIGLIIHSLI